MRKSWKWIITGIILTIFVFGSLITIETERTVLIRAVASADPDSQNFTGETSDGWIEGVDEASNYLAAHATSDGAGTGYAYLLIGQHYDYDVDLGEDMYEVYRTYLDFNTSTLPDDAIVTDVKLSLKAQYDYSDKDIDIKIYKFNWTEPIVSVNWEANYDAAGAVYDADWRNTSGMSLNTYYDSSSLDNSWVNLTGDTKYQLRSDRDVSQTEPVDEDEFIRIYSASSAGNEPILKVTYRLRRTFIISLLK